MMHSKEYGIPSNNNIQKTQARLQFSDSLLLSISKPSKNTKEITNWKDIFKKLVDNTQLGP